MSRTIHHEISDSEKRDFAAAVERLSPLLELVVKPSDAEYIADEEEDETVDIEKVSHFSLDGKRLIINIGEVHDLATDEYSMGWTVEVIPPLIVVEGIRLATRNIHSVDWRPWYYPEWEAGYDSDTTSQTPYDLSPKACPTDHHIEVKAFYDSSPTVEERDERSAQLEEEMEEHDSEHPREFRFTRQRLQDLLPMLGRLGPEHLVDQPNLGL